MLISLYFCYTYLFFKIMGEFTKHLQLFYMFPLRWGVCIPSPCSESDLSNITAQGMISVYQLHLLNMRDFQFYKHFQGQVKTLIHVYLKRIFICSFFFSVQAIHGHQYYCTSLRNQRTSYDRELPNSNIVSKSEHLILH